MKFWEAMKALEEGEKVRCKGCYPTMYIHKDGDNTRDKDPCLYWTRYCHKEWEVFVGPEKSYTFMEAVKGLKEGRKYRRPVWREGCTLESGGTDRIVCFTDVGPAIFTTDEFEAIDWIEVK